MRAPLVWDFYREVEDAEKSAGMAEYYDTETQRFYIENGLSTRVATVSDGHWRDTQYASEIGLSSVPYTVLRWDTPTAKQINGAGISDGHLYYLRYNGGIYVRVGS
jgi:hypothetical protein